MDPVTEAAIAAVGAERPKSWTLRPSEHVALLKDKDAAAPLVRLLERTEVAGVIEAYETANRGAVAAQSRYKFLARSAALAGFFAISGASLTLLSPLDNALAVYGRELVFVQLALLLYAFLASFWISRAKPYRRWMERRAEAEQARVDLFERMIEEGGSAASAEARLPALLLEYFRRFQLDVQLFNYRKRGRGFRRSAMIRQALRAVAILLILLCVAHLAGPLVAERWPPQQPVWLAELYPRLDWIDPRAVLGFGVIGGALHGLLAAWAQVSNAGRNGARYRRLEEILKDLRGERLEEARRNAARGGLEDIREFAGEVHAHMMGEHLDWVSHQSARPERGPDDAPRR